MSDGIMDVVVTSQSSTSDTSSSSSTCSTTDIVHSPGPLDGSLYAKIKKSKRSENHVTEKAGQSVVSESTNQNSSPSTNHSDNTKGSANRNPRNPNVIVLNGNKIIYKPPTELDTGQLQPAPLASLSEFSNLSFTSTPSHSIVTSSSLPVSPTHVTRLELSPNLTEPVVSMKKIESANLSPKNMEKEVILGNMESGHIQQQHTLSDVIEHADSSGVTKQSNNAINPRDSTLSSCSATTLSSTETDDGEVHPELSETDTCSEASTADEERTLGGAISQPEGSISPPSLGTTVEPETPETPDADKISLPLGGEESGDRKIFEATPPLGVATLQSQERDLPSISIKSPSPPEGTVTQPTGGGVMYNGGVTHGIYDKGPEYAVPMRDMKITTIPSKRAILVSADTDDGIGNETMASPTDSQGDQRDSFYDEGNYNGTGYTTIEEYATENNAGQNSNLQTLDTDISHLPEDLQALLNGLQDGPTCSDIDSGFHGSAIALAQTKSSHERANMTSQSFGEFNEPYHPANTFSQNYAEKVIPHLAPEVQHARVSDVEAMTQHFGGSKEKAPQAIVTQHFSSPMHHGETGVREPVMVGREVKVHTSSTPAKVQGVTMATQTLPEPQEARVEIITMRNVYETDPSQYDQHSPVAVSNEYVRSPTPKLVSSPIYPVETETSRTLETVSPVSMATENSLATDDSMETEEPFFEDVEDQMEQENMINVEEQIRHTQKHLQFLQEQQEKLLRRRQGRTLLRQTLKRNSSAFESHSSGYDMAPRISSTLPRPPHRHSEFRMQSASVQDVENVPPVANANQAKVVVQPAKPSQSQDQWQLHGRSLGRRVSDSGYDRQQPNESKKTTSDEPEIIPKKEKPDLIMASSDLQEQLAELDRCIAQLTSSIDTPAASDVPDSAPPVVVHRRRSFSIEIERKMDPNIPQEETKSLQLVPRPPARSRSSFDSYKRLSQEFDGAMKRRSLADADVNDEVFSPGPVGPQRSKQPSFPPQTSVTRRQQGAPAPPPKRRLSLEERISPILLQSLMMNPGAKPKENIHSFKEDLDPDQPPATPSFPITPTTPYVNSESPVRTKSPPGLMKTPLSMLHLKPTDSPTEVLHHHEEGKTEPKPISGSPSSGGAMQNGHVKETALLSDEGTRRYERLEARDARRDAEIDRHVTNNGQNNGGEHAGKIFPQEVVHTNIVSVHRDIQAAHAPPVSHPTPSPGPISPQQHMPPQYQHNHSGASHSSHSPAATSSNSRHGSSDSLDGPSTRHSNSSLLSSSSSTSSPHPVLTPTSPNNVMRPGSQMSSYDRNFHMQVPGTRSGDESLSPQSGRTSSSSISDVDRLNHEMAHASVMSSPPNFVHDTTAYWYKPDITRDQALALLRNKLAGCFVVRDSRCFPGGFGLALKVDKLPPTVQAKPGVDVTNEYVRHFLIEPSTRGVKLKGCPNEPVFGSLSALVYQHSITPLALPCKLIIPTTDQEIPSPSNSARNSQQEVAANSAADLLKQGAACNVLYIGSVDTESLTGPQAIERAIRETYQTAKSQPNKTSIVHFKVSPQGITLTDNARKIFFRRHYPTTTITYCGLDPQGHQSKGVKQRRWDATRVHGNVDAWLFGFVARKQAGSSDNMCHVFAELDATQPARAIVNFVTKVLIGTSRQNYP